MRHIFRSSQPAPAPSANEGRSQVDSEQPSPDASRTEPMGHVHDVYRHMIWLGLQHRQTH